MSANHLTRFAPDRALLALIGITVVYLALGTLYATRVPIFQNPDEVSHFTVVEHVAVFNRFPEAVVAMPNTYEALQPPVYYFLMRAPFELSGASKGETVLALRLTGVAIGALLIPLSFAITQGALGDITTSLVRRTFGVAVAGFVGLIPQRIANNASVNNDVLGEVCAAAAILVVLGMTSDRMSVKAKVGLGLLLGLVLLSKLTGAPAVVAVFIGIALIYRRRSRSWREVAVDASVVALIAAAVVAPWLLSNLDRYGDLLGTSRFEEFHGDFYQQPTWGANEYAGLDDFVFKTFGSFWLYLGWLDTPADSGLYAALGYAFVALFAGAILWLAQRLRGPPLAEQTEMGMIVLSTWVFGQVVMFAAFNSQFFQPQGRYLFPALPAIAVISVTGLYYWLSRLGREPRRSFSATVAVFLGALLALNAYAHLAVVPRIPRGPCPTCEGGHLLERAKLLQLIESGEVRLAPAPSPSATADS